MRHLKKFTVGISFLLFLFIFIPTVKAEDGQVYVVGTEALEIKNAPEQNAEVIGQLVRGDKVKIFQDKYDWVQTYYDGQVAWVASQYLIPINADEQDDTVKEPESSKITKIVSDQGEIVKTSSEWNKVESPDVMSASTEITNNTIQSKEQSTQLKNQKLNRSLSDYHIVIDPGHGGKDPGAVGVGGVYEKDLTLRTAKIVAEKLQNEGATVTLSRSDDSYISLDKRVEISNKNKTNVFISLHYNAFDDPDAEGITTYYSSGEENQKLAQTIHSSLINYANLSDRGAKQADYYVLSNNNKLAILVELGFISNPNELEKIDTTEYQEKVAEGITDGLKDYFND